MRRTICIFLLIPILLLSACTIGSGGSNIDEPEPTKADTNGTSTKSAPTDTSPTVTGNPALPSQSERQIRSFLIPEGYTFWQIAQKLEKEGICIAKEFFITAENYDVISFSVPKDEDAAYRYEGYLFPDTYEFYTGEDPVDVLRKMLNNYAAKSGMPDRKTLILASMIEREVRSDEQMALVSSVFHNRINDKSQKLRLESDPTIHYVEQNIVQKGTLIKNPDRFRTLYNTYRKDDFNSKLAPLPAGPICNPGIRAINAAKNPAKSNYFFFFFSADNENHYSETYEEHQEKAELYGVGNY